MSIRSLVFNDRAAHISPQLPPPLPPAHDYRVLKAEGVFVERFVQAAAVSRLVHVPAAARRRNIHAGILRGQKRLRSERDLLLYCF